jgi:hypothetical protein
MCKDSHGQLLEYKVEPGCAASTGNIPAAIPSAAERKTEAGDSYMAGYCASHGLSQTFSRCDSCRVSLSDRTTKRWVYMPKTNACHRLLFI